ncbi:abnormal spindle-like microcephaly-associated protein homolog isoform X2 [Argiope bruennichi]|uniref:abnormal spindle-like microcephaly-associated protein homolog isoform X2 n=1 Tax=Argiope bruennichi TaxID=94029 RepID=UPI002493F7FF|nr:abnormal spindle-like microcephaly-associated protein homolog isoform X2 [Argiope bruennichi]
MDFYKNRHSPKHRFRPKPQCFVIKAQCSPEIKEEERYVLELKPFAVAPHLVFDKVEIGTSKTCTLYLHNPAEFKQLVCIEKFPFEKGFQICDVEFLVPSLEEISIDITWTPEKSICCRETVLFKTSSCIRSQVFFHGTSHTPKKQKRKKIKQITQKSPKISKVLPNAGLPVTFEEDRKENVDFDYQKDTDFTTLGTPNFCHSRQMPLQPLDELTDSPIRRQTYTINSIFRASCAGSDIGNFCMAMNQTKDKNILQERFIKSDQNHVSNAHADFQNSFIDQPSLLEYPLKESRDITTLKEKLLKCDESLEIFPPVNENRKTFFLSSANQEVVCQNGKNQKSTQMAIVKPNIQKDLNAKQLIQAEKNKEIFNDSLEGPTSDLCNRSINEVESSVPNLEPHQDEMHIKKNEPQFFAKHSNFNASNSLQEQKINYLRNSRDSTFTKKSLSSVAFEVPNADSPKLSETTFNLPHLYSSKQNRVTKPKSYLNIPKKQIRNLNLSKTTVGTPKNVKGESFSSLYMSDCKSSMSSHPRLNQIKNKTMEKVTHWNPYASFNAYYDEYWKEKQEAAFTNWLNFILTPIDDLETDDVKVNSAAIWVESMKDAAPLRAPSKEELSFKTYTAIKQLNQLRKAACNLYQSEELSTVIKKIEQAVDSKKILIRKDRALHADLGIKKDLLEMLLSYNPLWLRIGLENSRSLLLTFSREYLSGEGDLTKHLRYLGCVVQHEQVPLEEFDYAVRNIAVDLRCGLRLGRVVEILLQDWSIFKSLRANTLNRLAKIHNNEVIFKALEKASIQIEDNIDPRDIVDGNREKTLSLLWQIIFKTQISKCLNLEVLKKENSYLKRSLQLKADVATFNALQNLDETGSFEVEFLNSKLYKENEVIQQLFQWCQNVCAHYGVKVLNFTTSFSDGRALCFIIHHYHPNLLPQNKIHKETTCHYFEKQMEAEEEGDCPFRYGNMTHELKNKLMKNEKENVDIAFQKFQEIGQIPILSFPSHVRNKIPDEKVVITLMSYVNMRLMELSVEIRAARTILLAYRKWCLRRKQAKLMIQIAAIIKIQRFLRSYIMRKRKEKEEAAAVCIQRCWRMFSAKKELECLRQAKHMKYLNEKASVIQAAYRKFRAARYQQKHIYASIVLQSHIRKWLERKKYVMVRSSAIKIQQWWRARLVGKEVRLSFLVKKQLITLLQSHVRRLIAQKDFKIKRESAILIQRNMRKVIAQRRFSAMKLSVLCIENWWSNILLSRKIRHEYLICQKAAIRIQTTWRMYLQKKHFKDLKKAVSIVIWYRSCKKQRIMYLKTRENIIKLQALFRRYRDRKEYCKKKGAAIKIQSVFRGYYMRKRFLKMKSAVILIQKYYRGYQLVCHYKHQFTIMKSGFIRLQAQFRGFKARKELHKQIKAAVIIQSIFRSYSARKKFLSLKSDVIKIQKFYRGYRLMTLEKKNFLALKEGFITLQAFFRGYKARKEFLSQKKAAICIQSTFRGYHSRKTFLALKSSAIKIQKYYRGYLLMRQERHNFLIQKIGFEKLQAHFRGYRVRKEFCIQKRAAITIQSAFRSYICQKRFLVLRSNVIKIQKYYRGYKLMCMEKKKYFTQKAGFAKLQAQFRAYKTRKQFIKQKTAAVVIQSAFRCYISKKKYLILKSSVTKIQQYYRGYRLMCTEKQKYAIQKTGFTKLQAQFRAYKTRKQFIKQKTAAVVIQSAFRCYISKKKYLILKSSVTKIQQYYQGYRLMCTEKQKYAIQKTGFTKLQAQFRAYKTRKQFIKQKTAAVVIQSAFRCYISKKKYLILKSSVTKIQQYYQGYRLMCTEKQKYAIQKTGFTKLQAQFRAYKTRKQFIKQKTAAVVIQSAFRCYISKKKYLILKSSVTKIQQYYQGYRLMCTEKQKYAIQKTGFIKLQAQFRAYKARKEFFRKKRAAIKIQSMIRSYIIRKKYLSIKLAVMKIQRYYRGYILMCLENEKYIIQKTGFAKLQALYRSHKARKQFIKLRISAVMIQSAFKGYSTRKKYFTLKSSALKIQRYYRGYRLMCFEKQKFLVQKIGFTKLQAQFRAYKGRKEFCLQKSAAIKIQSSFRCYIMRKKYLSLKSAVVKIQKYYHGYQLMCSEKKKYLVMKTGFIKLQAVWRGIMVRNNTKNLHKSAVIIQSHYRRFIAMKHYRDLKQKCIIIQRKYRGWQLMKKNTAEYHKIRQSIILIQAAFRCHLLRKRFLTGKTAAIKLQSFVRMLKCRKEYLCARSKIIFIQQLYHFKYLMKIKKRSCIQIQAYWRGYRVRRDMKKMSAATVLIQRWWRKRKLCMDSANHRQWYLRLKVNTIKFQRNARDYLQRRTKAAIKIQTSWRAYAVRRSVTDKKIIRARQNIKAAPAEEYNTLGCKTQRALKVLLTDQNIRNILTALQTLKVCTQLSAVCCERLQQSGGLAVIIHLLRSCNRSVPHQEIIKFSTDILLNLCKYKKTVDSVWSEKGSLIIILDLMNIYREKGLPIFTKCTTLFWIFCQDPEKAEMLKKNSEFIDQVKRFYNLLLKRKLIEEKKKATAASCSLRLKKFSTVDTRDSIEPDWILGRRKMREFKDSFTAISALMQSLGLTT